MPTRRVKYAFWLVGIVAALLIVWYLWLSKGTPQGQPALASVTQNNFDQFKHDFNGADDEARLVLLLSPT
jgi:bacteriorhodopsin